MDPCCHGHSLSRIQSEVPSRLPELLMTSSGSGPKTSLKIKFLGWIFLAHQGPARRDIPDPGPAMSRTKTLCKAPFSVASAKGMAAMSRDLGRDARNLNSTQKGIKTDGFQNRKFWGLSKLALLVHQQIWYPFGWFFGTQKGIKTDGFQNRKFWALSKLAIFGA